MSDKDILQVAKEILENEEVLAEASPVAPEVKPKKKGATNVDAEGDKPEASPSVNTDTVEDEDIYKSADGVTAKVIEPDADDADADDNADQVKAKPSSAAATQEHMDALFGGEELSEDFRNKATTIFTVALKEREDAIRQEVQESFDAKLEEEVNTISNDLSEKLDDYLNYVVKEWMEENEIAIEHGIKNEISESLISDLKQLFENHNIEIPEDSFDALEEANGKIEELTSKLNEQLEKNIELSKGNEDLECSEVFTKVCKDLTDTDTEKLRSLAEGLEFETVEQYNEKLNLLKDSYFNESANEKSTEEENTITEDTAVYGSQINDYVKSIGRVNAAARQGAK
tara:strand:+ start:13394 stop:14422 length:1029 start_codon:yes stop_codon:yes gene_type:complete